MNLNLYLFNLLNEFAGQFWPLDWIIIFFATYLAPLIIIMVLIWVFRHQSFKTRFSLLSYFILSTIISFVIVIVIQSLIDITRPFTALDIKPLINQSSAYSFPSVHVTITTAIALSVWLINRKFGLWILFGAFLIGIGRIIAGVHWPSDVLVGFIIGAIGATVAYKLFPHKEYLVIK